ncbi:hypothetical protein [Massilia rubra]|nr:hypothetical protein [Massilia rubra]
MKLGPQQGTAIMPRLGGFFEAPYSQSKELLDAQNQVINEVMRGKIKF